VTTTVVRTLAITAVITVLVAACSQSTPLRGSSGQTQTGSTAASAQSAVSFSQFPDLPIPDEAEMDVERTLVFGSGAAWFGQVAISAPHTPNDMFDFYKGNLKRYGWQEVTSVRAPTSVLTHIRENRVLAIQISEATLRGSNILLTVSPKENSGATNTN